MMCGMTTRSQWSSSRDEESVGGLLVGILFVAT